MAQLLHVRLKIQGTKAEYIMFVFAVAGKDVWNTSRQTVCSSSVAMHLLEDLLYASLVIYLETLEGTKF
jgi:hypothetical protein